MNQEKLSCQTCERNDCPWPDKDHPAGHCTRHMPIRKKAVEKKIATILTIDRETSRIHLGDYDEEDYTGWDKSIEELTATILAIPEIKEGQELLEKAKSGKLVELHRNQSWPKNPHGFTDRQMRLHFYECHDQCHSAEQEAAEAVGFRRVKVK